MKLEKEIIKWFKMVCKGIHDEYEAGASHRNPNQDIGTLKILLMLLRKDAKNKNKMSKEKTSISKMQIEIINTGHSVLSDSLELLEDKIAAVLGMLDCQGTIEDLVTGNSTSFPLTNKKTYTQEVNEILESGIK